MVYTYKKCCGFDMQKDKAVKLVITNYLVSTVLQTVVICIAEPIRLLPLRCGMQCCLSIRVGHGSILLTQSNPIKSVCSQLISSPIHKYMVLNLTRTLRATNYSNADFFDRGKTGIVKSS